MPHAPQTQEVTPEQVMEMGKEWINAILDAAPLEEILHRHQPDEVLQYYDPEQRLKGLTDEQRLKGLTDEQRLKGLTDEQICAYLERLQRGRTQ